MSNKQIRHLLTRLSNEIQNTELDADTRELVRELDDDIHDLLDTNGVEAKLSAVLERAEALEADFATKHPTAERFLRELMDALARMGI